MTYKERLKKNAPMSLHEYIALEGTGTDDGMRKRGEAERLLAAADTSHGALGESLVKSGLDGGGYEQYLMGQAADKSRELYGAAREASLSAEADTKAGYAAYLSDYENVQRKISDSVIKHFSEGTVFDIDEAYRYAVGAGLSADSATVTAARAVRAAKENTADYVIRLALRTHMSPKQARYHGKKYGLDEQYLKRIYSAVAALSDEEKEYFSSASADTYLKYIERQNS